MLRFIVLLFLTTVASLSWGATASRDLVATVNSKISNQSVVIQIQTPEGTHLNYEGPWRLNVDGSLKFKSNSFGIEAFSKEKQLFALDLNEKPSKLDSGHFKLAYFLCSNDNVWCKR